MSIETENLLRDILDRHTICLHDKQLAHDAAAAVDLDFMRQYLAHRNNVIAPTLNRLKDVVCEYGQIFLSKMPWAVNSWKPLRQGCTALLYC